EPGSVQFTSVQLIFAQHRQGCLDPAGFPVVAPDARVAARGVLELDDRRALIGSFRIDLNRASAAEPAKPDARPLAGKAGDASQSLGPAGGLKVLVDNLVRQRQSG